MNISCLKFTSHFQNLPALGWSSELILISEDTCVYVLHRAIRTSPDEPPPLWQCWSGLRAPGGWSEWGYAASSCSCRWCPAWASPHCLQMEGTFRVTMKGHARRNRHRRTSQRLLDGKTFPAFTRSMIQKDQHLMEFWIQIKEYISSWLEVEDSKIACTGNCLVCIWAKKHFVNNLVPKCHVPRRLQYEWTWPRHQQSMECLLAITVDVQYSVSCGTRSK